MWRIKLRTSDKGLLNRYNRVQRELTPKGKWSYYTLTGWFVKECDAKYEANRHTRKGLVVSIYDVSGMLQDSCTNMLQDSG
jgi:hypothetical protein